ncbi:MAG TPA: TonB-dependent receptor [Bacteroidales bacterium]|nr:TonB-dependent receptor [Bacteroidales bacterium]
MSIKAFFAVVFFLIFPVVNSQEEYVIDWDIDGQSFEDFVLKAESQFPVKFFYNDEWVKNLTLGRYGNRPVLTQVLETLLRRDSIYCYVNKSGNIILTKGFKIKIAEEEMADSSRYIPGIDYSGTEELNSGGGNLVLDIGNPADRNRSGNITLSGTIINRDTREPVAGVTVYIPKLSAGTISNAFGFYSMNIPRGNYSVRFTFIGMKERTVDLNLFGPGELNLEMTGVLIPLKEAVITAEKDITLQRLEVGVEKINIKSFRLMPTSMGESDITKSVLLIPGVHSVGEGSAGFNVRGGSTDQNLILLYGAPVYNSSHFFGFFSAVNPDIIKDVTLFKGGIPARYGGRLSSVLDIIPRDGNRREFNGNAGISPVTTHFVVEGPLKKDTLYYLIAGRTTYSNWILGIIENPALRNSRASFYDLNARIAYDIGRNNKIDFSTYYSNDSFRLNSDSTYNYQNNISSLRWRHFFSSRFFSSFIVNNSFYRYNISSLRVPQEAFSLTHRVNSSGLKADFNLFNGRHEINFGSDINRYDIMPGNYLPADDSSIVIPSSVERQRAIETALYVEDKYIVTNYLSINAGLRVASFFAMGPQTVLIYDPSYPRSVSSVTDTIKFGRLKNYKTYSGPELRLSANFRLNDNSSVKLNYNRTYQYLHLLSNTISISPSDIWKLSDFNLKPQSCDQYAAGYYRMLNKNKIEASAEIYYKRINNMADFKGGTDLVMNQYVERDLINVYGKAYGLELLVKKPEGRIRWSFSYTYSRVLIRSKGSFDEERINSGKWFPANFDRPHDLILTFNYLYSRRVSFSANYNFSSGRPVTYPISFFTIGDIVLTNYSERNKYRLPFYSRFDLAVKVSGDLKSKRIAHPYWIFSVYNVTGRENVYSVYFKNVRNTVRGYYLSVFGRPIPSISFNFDF